MLSVPELAYAYKKPDTTSNFRERPEDFIVEERLGFEPSGEGEHRLVWLEKIGQNTQWLAKQLAHCAGINPKDVGYCGLKDRHGITRQWFSLYCPKARALQWDLNTWAEQNIEGTQVLALALHQRKLRPGDHAANHFEIRLRNVTDADEVEARLALVATGVPNYFGEQRFGHDNNNLAAAETMFSKQEGPRQVRGADKKQRGFIISAARSHLFNQVLSARVRLESWREPIEGESLSYPSGPLWGRGRPLVSGQAAELEYETLAPWLHWCEGLEHVGLQQERRALVCQPQNFTWQWQAQDCLLSFALAPGQYATAVLREVTHLHNQMHPGL